MYSLRPKKDCPIFRTFPVPKWLSGDLLGQNSRLKVKYVHTQPSTSRSLSTPQLPGAFWSSCHFRFSESYLRPIQSMISGLNLTQAMNTDNHYGTEGVLQYRFIRNEWAMLLRGITQQCFESLMMNIMLLYHAQSYMFYNVRTTYRTLMKEKSTLKYCKLQRVNGRESTSWVLTWLPG